MTKEIRFTKEDWKLFFVSLFSGVFVYFSRIVNELPNPDAIWQGMAYKPGWGWEAGLGRYMIFFLQKMRSNIIGTEYVSLSCLLFLAVICVLLVKIFDVTDTVLRFVLAGLIIISPTVGATLSYYYCSDMYFLSYLLAVGGVFFCVLSQSWIGVLLFALGICFSAAIYQAYVGMAITLCFLILWYMLLDEKYSLKEIAKRAGQLLLGGAMGILLYLASNSFIQSKFGIYAVEDRGFASMGQVSIGQLPDLIKSVYRIFFEYFFSATMINNEWGGKRTEINCLFGIGAILLVLAVLLLKKCAIQRKLLFVLGFLFMPVPFLSIVIMAPEVSVYDTTGVLMMPTMNYVYVAFLLLFVKHKELFGDKLQKTGKYALVGCCVMVCYMLLMLEISGQTYIKHHVNKTQAVAEMIVDEIEELVDNSANYRVCFVGVMEDGNFPEIYPELSYSTQWTTASYKTVWNTFGGRQNCWINYMAHYLGKRYNACSQADYDSIIQSKEYSTMQNFPDENSVAVVGDVIVVKLSDA